MGFKIVRDFIKDKGEKGAVGIESIPPTHWFHYHPDKDDTDYCYNGGTIKVRLKDDDDNIYYHALVDDADFSAELVLEWSTGYAGCVSLDLAMSDWNELTSNREHPYPSKDGKWVAYIG